MGAEGWLLMALFWIALIALMVFAAVRLFPADAAKPPGSNDSEQPKEILRRRLASGDIDADTFDQLSSKLATGSTAGTR
ncbi:MAG: hypothetical protein M0T77_05600 [Actinomycetota bacterium]|nr:hypothetical protein [Actinomycetota bacterium]